jgi:hypothetical protein
MLYCKLHPGLGIRCNKLELLKAGLRDSMIVTANCSPQHVAPFFSSLALTLERLKAVYCRKSLIFRYGVSSGHTVKGAYRTLGEK